jgi:N-acetylmuramoyl-L-alanine amidase
MPFPDKSKGFEDQEDVILLAMLVWGEARGEPQEGKDAVAHSVLNRLSLSPHFGHTLKEVILKPWAYSSFNANDPNRQKLLDPVAHGSRSEWASALTTAHNAMNGVTADASNGATHYVVVDLWRRQCPEGRDPKWFEAPEVDAGHTRETARIGNQVFAKAA